MPLHGPVPIVVLPRSRTAITLHPRPTPYSCASIQPFRSPHKVRLNSNLSTDRLRLPMRHLFPSSLSLPIPYTASPAHISTQSHPFSFPSSTNHLHRLQARPGGYSASTAHTCTPLFGGTTVERPGTPRNVIFQSLLPLPLTPSSSSPPAPPRSRTTTPPRFRDAHLFLIGWRRL